MSQRLLFALVLACFLAACSRTPSRDGSNAGDHNEQKDPRPTIDVHMSERGKPDQPFTITIALPAEPNDHHTHKVHLDASDPFDYGEKLDFDLKPGEQLRIKAKLKEKLDSGLAEVNISADGYQPFLYTVDAGFTAKLKALVPASLDSTHGYPLTLQLVDDKDSPVRLDAAANLVLTALNGKLQSNDADPKHWADGFKMDLRKGSSSSPSFMLRPTSVAGDPVVLVAQLTPAASDVSLIDQRLELPVMPAWWYTLLLAIAGACVPPIYRFITAIAEGGECNRTICFRGAMKLLTGAIAGCIAYLFAAWDIIGVKLDMSSSRTFLILGFLFSYVGVDVLLRRVLGDQASTKAAAEGDAKDPEPEAPDADEAAAAKGAGSTG